MLAPAPVEKDNAINSIYSECKMYQNRYMAVVGAVGTGWLTTGLEWTTIIYYKYTLHKET